MFMHEAEELIKKAIDNGDAETGIFYCEVHPGYMYVCVDIEYDDAGNGGYKFAWHGGIQVISALINEE